MTDKYESLLEEMRQSGEIPDSWLDKIQSTYESSGLRTDLKETRDKYRAVMDQNNSLRATVLAQQFKNLGIAIKPQAFNIPEDLDPTDDEKVTNWAASMGLVDIKPTTDPAERAAHDRIAQAANEDTNAVTAALSELDPDKLSEDEYYAKAAAIRAKIKQ